MAQQLIHDFVAELRGRIELPEPIVEFGSMQVEPDQPTDLRPLFAGRDFTGTDMREGPGVDRVEDLRALSFADGSIGTALCLDTLEHCADPLTACREMHRVLAPGGVCVISSVMIFPIHDYPNDYWRFTPEGFAELLAPFDDVWATGVGYAELPMQVIAIGAKGHRLGIDGFDVLRAEQERWERSEGRFRIGFEQVPLRELARTVGRQAPRVMRERLRARIHRAG